MPCQPSITCGPLTPSPRRKRPQDIEARLIAVIATSAGVRVPACMIPAPRWMREVRAARNASGVTASWPQASADHTQSTPRRSASTTQSLPALQSSLASRSEMASRMGTLPGHGEGLRDLLELPGVVEVVQAVEQQGGAPVERAEHRVLDAAVERAERVGHERAREQPRAVRLEDLPPLVGGAERSVLVPPPLRPRRQRLPGDDRLDGAAEVPA